MLRKTTRQADFDSRLDAYSLTASGLRAVNAKRTKKQRGIAYAAAAAAGAALVGAGPAEATLIQSPLQGQMFSVNTSRTVNQAQSTVFFNTYLDIDGDAIPDLGLRLSAAVSTQSRSQTNTFSFNPGYSVGKAHRSDSVGVSGPQGAALSAALITNLSRTVTGTTTGAVGFFGGGGGGTVPNLAWFSLKYLFSPGLTKITFTDFIYDDTPGAGIHVGDSPAPVPEPATAGLMGLGLLALGAAGLRERRRRKIRTQISE